MEKSFTLYFERLPSDMERRHREVVKACRAAGVPVPHETDWYLREVEHGYSKDLFGEDPASYEAGSFEYGEFKSNSNLCSVSSDEMHIDIFSAYRMGVTRIRIREDG